MIEGHDYTIYSNGPSGRARMYALLAVITAFLTPLVQHWVLLLLRRYAGEDWDIAQIALFFGGFTALLLFGLLTNLFDNYLWRNQIGKWLFRLAGLSAPPDLSGKYYGNIEVQSAADPQRLFRTAYFMEIAQTWERISLLIERDSESGGRMRLHSDLASVRVGMMVGVTTLRLVYTFEENLPRREGIGTMARQFSGAATLEFRREGEAWLVTGHFFDDIGRSGQLRLGQGVAGVTTPTPEPPPTAAVSEPKPTEADTAKSALNVKSANP